MADVFDQYSMADDQRGAGVVAAQGRVPGHRAPRSWGVSHGAPSTGLGVTAEITRHA